MKPSEQSAMTVLELLVAVTVGSLLCGSMVLGVQESLRHARRLQGAEEAGSGARQVFAALERDLASLHGMVGTVSVAADLIESPGGLANHGWLLPSGCGKAGGAEGLAPCGDPSGPAATIATARFGLAGVWLRFVGTNVESGGSLPVVLAYQVVRRPVTGNPIEANPAPVRYALYRTAVSPADTFNAGYDVTAAAYASPSNNPSGVSSTTYRTPRNVMNPSHANLLAANVVDFGCWLHARGSDGQLERVFPASADSRSYRGGALPGNGASQLPVVVDVVVRVLADEDAARLAAMESGKVTRSARFDSDAAWWWAFVAEHAHVFVRRFVVQRREVSA